MPSRRGSFFPGPFRATKIYRNAIHQIEETTTTPSQLRSDASFLGRALDPSLKVASTGLGPPVFYVGDRRFQQFKFSNPRALSRDPGDLFQAESRDPTPPEMFAGTATGPCPLGPRRKNRHSRNKQDRFPAPTWVSETSSARKCLARQPASSCLRRRCQCPAAQSRSLNASSTAAPVKNSRLRSGRSY